MRTDREKAPKVVLMIESSRAPGRALLCGIARYAHERGPWSYSWKTRGLGKTWPRFRKIEADGFILRDVENVDEVLNRVLPTVIIEHKRREVSGQVNVVTDSEAIGRLAAEHPGLCA